MKTTNKKFKGDKSELIFYCALLALPLLQIVIFYFYVNFNSFLMAFQRFEFPDKFIGNKGANFVRLWQELVGKRTLLVALKNSALAWFFTSGVGTFLSIVFAYYIFKKWPLAKTFKFILFLPSVLPSILLSGVFRFFVDTAIPGYAEVFTGTKINALLSGNTLFPTVLFYNVWVCFGAQLLIYTGAMDQISPEIIEAGEVDGVTPIIEFFLIVVPMILPTVATFIIASVATLFTNQANLFAFFGEQALTADYTIGYYLYKMVSNPANMNDYPYASALGLVCTLIAFPLTMLVKKLLDRGEA